MADLEWLREHQSAIRSLNDQIGDQEDSTELQDLVCDNTRASVVQQADHVLLTEALTKLLNKLKPSEQTVLKLRFGLTDGQSHTLVEIGNQLDLLRERVRQIERQALEKLRKQKASLNDFR